MSRPSVTTMTVLLAALSAGSAPAAVQAESGRLAAVDEALRTTGDGRAVRSRKVLRDGFVGEIGGNTAVFGTKGFQDVTLRDQAGVVDFDPSFNRGGDIIRLPHDAASYTVSRQGSSAVFESGDRLYTIPIGPAGTKLVFADGPRVLAIDENGEFVRIGRQAITPEPAPVAASAD